MSEKHGGNTSEPQGLTRFTREARARAARCRVDGKHQAAAELLELAEHFDSEHPHNGTRADGLRQASQAARQVATELLTRRGADAVDTTAALAMNLFALLIEAQARSAEAGKS